MNSVRYYLQFTYEIYLALAAIAGARFNPDTAKNTTPAHKVGFTVKYIPYVLLGGWVIAWIACIVVVFKVIEGEDNNEA